jgi:UDP-3-O-[3-hydroxymyristoyl] glucosamine N-acyltransferase
VRVSGIAPIEIAGEGGIAPLLSAKYAKYAEGAIARGAALLVDVSLAKRSEIADGNARVWLHANASWALADLLDRCDVAHDAAKVGAGSVIGANVVVHERVTIGQRVTIGAGSVIGRAGFGWAFDASKKVRAIPQLGGVVIEDDVVIGPLCTIDAGTLAPTRIRRGAKLDAQCHIAHNCDIGEDVIIAAQSGFAGSVRIGRGALIGGQVGVADHVTIGEGARVAGKSGVIGDIAAHAVVAGYPAVPHARWLRALASIYRHFPGELEK